MRRCWLLGERGSEVAWLALRISCVAVPAGAADTVGVAAEAASAAASAAAEAAWDAGGPSDSEYVGITTAIPPPQWMADLPRWYRHLSMAAQGSGTGNLQYIELRRGVVGTGDLTTRDVASVWELVLAGAATNYVDLCRLEVQVANACKARGVRLLNRFHRLGLAHQSWLAEAVESDSESDTGVQDSEPDEALACNV